MINAATSMIASIAGSQDRPGAGLVKATVVGGPDREGAFLLRLDGGRELSVQIVGKDVALAPGQNVLISPSDGKIFMPDAAQMQQLQQQGQLVQTQVEALAGQPAQQLSAAADGTLPAAGRPQEHLRDSFESPLLRSIPASVWEQVLGGSTSKADIETLKALDNILQNRSIPIDPASPVQMERIGQWLRIVLDNPHLIEDLAERIPTSGAKDIVGLMELIGRVGAGILPKDALTGIAPEQFFVTADKIIGGGIPVDKLLALGIDKNLIAALSSGLSADKLLALGIDKNLIAALGINTDTGVNAGISAGNRAALIEVLLKSTFSAAPTALLDLMKQINTSNAASLAPLPPAEAQRIVSSIVNTLPAQTALKPELLHDARQISPQNLNADLSAPQKPSLQTSVIPRIRSEYSGLTESAIQLLLGNDSKKAAAEVRDRINTLGKLVERIPIADNRGDRGQSVPVGDRGAVVDKSPVADRVSVAADKTFVANTAGGRGQPAIQTEIKANIPVDNRQHVAAADRAFIANTAGDRGRSPLQVSPVSTNEVRANIPVDNRQQALTAPARADNTFRPADAQTIRNDSMRIVDNLRSAAEPLLRGIERSNGLDMGEKVRLLDTVRNTISSLDTALRPLAREGRPVPQEFYDRVTSSPKHQISTDSKSEVFSRIGTAQEQIRSVIDSVQAKPLSADRGTATAVNANTPAQQLPNDRPAATVINTSAQPQQSLNNRAIPSAINTPPQQLYNDKPASTAVNTSTQSQQPPADKSTPNVINTSQQQLNNDKQPVSTGINTSTQPQQPPADKSAPDNFLLTAQRLWANTEKIRAGFQEAFSSLDLPNRVSPLESPADKSAAQIIKQSADALRTEMLLDVSRALRDIFSSVEELRNLVAQLADKLKGLPETEAALLRAMRDLEQQARQSGAEVNERLKEILRELSRLQADAVKSREAGAEAAARSPADLIRSAVTGAARGLENLQLLANQTRGAEVQQQVLALPVKMGEEWTEVHVKFVKGKRDGKDKKTDGHVSIYLNVAPSKLGSVTAHLDFHPPAALKLSLQSENPKATKWFREQASELRTALTEAGLPGTTLEFHTKRPATPKAEKKAAAAAKSGDTAASTNTGVVGSDGKVDFKI